MNFFNGFSNGNNGQQGYNTNGNATQNNNYGYNNLNTNGYGQNQYTNNQQQYNRYSSNQQQQNQQRPNNQSLFSGLFNNNRTQQNNQSNLNGANNNQSTNQIMTANDYIRQNHGVKQQQNTQGGFQPQQQNTQQGFQPQQQSMQQGFQPQQQNMQQGFQPQQQNIQQGFQPQQQNIQQGFQPQQQNMQGGFQPQQQNTQQQIPPEVTFEPMTDDLMKQVNAALGLGAKKTNESSTKIDTDDKIATAKHLHTENKGIKNESIPKTQTTIGVQPNKLSSGYEFNLENMIQSEKNASRFYRQLSNITNNKEYKDLFNEMSNDKETVSSRINEIYNGQKGNYYTINENKNEYTGSFRDGIKTAIMEEYKSIKELSKAFENADDKNSKYLNSVFYKKISDIGIMNSILSNNTSLY